MQNETTTHKNTKASYKLHHCEDMTQLTMVAPHLSHLSQVHDMLLKDTNFTKKLFFKFIHKTEPGEKNPQAEKLTHTHTHTHIRTHVYSQSHTEHPHMYTLTVTHTHTQVYP